MLGECASTAIFAHGDLRDRLSERSYLFTMSDIGRSYQILLDSICERGIVFPTDERFAAATQIASLHQNRELTMQPEANAA